MRVLSKQREQPTLLVSVPLRIGQRDALGQLVQDPSKLVPQCPEAIARGLTGCCTVVRNGTHTRHGVYAQPFPIALERVQNFKCTAHNKDFSFLTPCIWTNLPEDAEVQPEICMLTERTIMTAEYYNSLVHRTIRRTEFKSHAKELSDECEREAVHRLEEYGDYIRLVVGEAAYDSIKGLAAEMMSDAAGRLDFSGSVASGGHMGRSSSSSARNTDDWLAQAEAEEGHDSSSGVWSDVADEEGEDYMVEVPAEQLCEPEPEDIGDVPQRGGGPGTHGLQMLPEQPATLGSLSVPAVPDPQPTRQLRGCIL